MKYWFRLILLLSCPIGLIALIGSVLPRNYEFSCSIEIEAQPERVFDEMNQLSNWQSWSNWNSKLVSDLQTTGQSGVGNAMTWNDPRGSGKIWIVESHRPKLIEYRHRFGNFPESTSTISFEPANDQTTVHWKNTGRLPNGPFYGFMAPFFSSNMKPEYQKFLDQLKLKLEQNESTGS